jgi:hypothetical protein
MATEDAAARWSWFGPAKKSVKPLWVLLAISVVVAFETFVEQTRAYPTYMTLGVIAVAAWLVYESLSKKALIGLTGVVVVLPWLGQLLGTNWLGSSPVVFFLSHSLFAIFVATAAYTYMGRGEPQDD